MEEPLVPPGNAPRPRALIYVGAGFCALVVLMASDAHFALSLPLGLLATLLSAFGALDFAGCFDDAQAAELGHRSWSELGPRLLELGGAVVLWVAALRLAVAGVLPHPVWLAPLLVTLTSLAAALALGRLAFACAPTGSAWWRRPGLWLLLLGIGLYVPLLGCYSLLDPWEPHYGEVAREMLARDDWLSLWWAEERWFFSKPVLDFWLQGLFFVLLGVKFRPDEMLAGAAHGYLPQPEWAARMPVVLLTLGAVYALYRFVAAAAGKRIGFLSGLVLLCAPYWSLLGHQSMTDMPYVAPLTAAIALFGLGLLASPEELAPALSVGVWGRTVKLSAFHALFGLVLLTTLPQLAYLVSRNVSLQIAAPPYGFRWHLDEFFAGSGLGNCGLPGNDPCRGQEPSNAFFQPLLGALLFGAASGYLLFVNRGERRKKRLFYIAAWYFTALAALGKGAPGLVLPLVIAAAVLVARRDWLELTRVELASFCLMFAAVCLPWYVQEFMRHGEQFTDRLLFHDMYDRAFVHVHDTNTGTDVSLRYYIWQLGYGLFPWTGLAPLGIGLLLGRPAGSNDNDNDDRRRHRELTTLMLLWLTIAFALFTISLTKFHHYALPCAPPLAVGAALLLDRALGERRLPEGWRRLAYLAALGVAAALLVYGGMRLSPGTLFGRVLADGAPPDASPLEGCALIALGLLLTWFVARLWAPLTSPPSTDSALGVLAVPAALVSLLVARDLSTSQSSDVPGSARLLHLVTYNYKRTWPASLDFEAIQWGFGVAFALCLLLWLVPRFRLHSGVLLGAIGVWFCAFTLWIYLPLLAPHYGQRELFLAYYRARHGPEEPIAAYQMNWKGENFYSGNRLPAFVSTGAKFKKWLKAERKRGTRVIFFVTEHGRMSTLTSELGPGFKLSSLTDAQLNNKFALVRVELTNERVNASDDDAE